MYHWTVHALHNKLENLKFSHEYFFVKNALWSNFVYKHFIRNVMLVVSWSTSSKLVGAFLVFISSPWQLLHSHRRRILYFHKLSITMPSFYFALLGFAKVIFIISYNFYYQQRKSWSWFSIKIVILKIVTNWTKSLAMYGIKLNFWTFH